MPPAIAFAAPSGTGKSTAIVRVVEVLTQRGYRVGVLKHDAHRLSYDKPGKDTWRFRQAGAWRAVISGDHEVAVFSAPPVDPSPLGLVEAWFPDADLVLVEGYRNAGLSCIRVHRSDGPSDASWEPADQVVAWFSDVDVETDVPVLALADAKGQADWILAFLGLV